MSRRLLCAVPASSKLPRGSSVTKRSTATAVRLPPATSPTSAPRTMPPTFTSFAPPRAPLPPSPREMPVAGHVHLLRKFWRDPIGSLLWQWRTFGDVTTLRFGPQRVVFVQSAEGAHHVLVDAAKNYRKSDNYEGLRLFLGNGLLTSEGDFWKRQRRLAQPAFHKSRIERLVDPMIRCTDDLVEGWALSEERSLDVHQEMMRLTFRIVGLTLFGTDLDRDSGEIGRALDVGLRFADDYVSSIVRVPTWIPTPANRNYLRALATVDRVVLGMIAARRKDTTERHDLMSLLMDAKDEDTGVGMSDTQLRDEVATLVLAGHETTANLLTFAVSLVAARPEIEMRLVDEVERVLGDRAPTFADVAKLELTRAIIDETLRLFPPAWVVERQANEEDVVSGYRIPKDTIVAVAPYVLHRHPSYWNNPEAFDPERFMGPPDTSRPRYAYMPFGAGPRFCIGNSFALMEATLVLALLFRRARFALRAGHVAGLDPLITLRPKGGMPMRVGARRPGRRPA
ncbi:MAG: cytochrome P450 [Polyangiaceae bacterium]